MKDSIYICKNRDNFSMGQIIELLHKADWAVNRKPEDIIKSVENSICYGLFHKNGKLIGFARIITDFTTTFYLMDVIIEEVYRGQGFGKMLMDEIMNDVGHLYGILHTDSAQKFYERYGFKVTATSDVGETIMERSKQSYD